MIEVLQSALTSLRDLLGWAPASVVGAFILALAAILALLVHSIVLRLVRRFINSRHPYLAGVLAGTPHLVRLAFLIAALFVALPVAPFDRHVAAALAHVLLVAAIALIGWTAVTVTHITADLY